MKAIALLLLLALAVPARAAEFTDAKLLDVQKTWTFGPYPWVGAYEHWLVTVQLGDERITGITPAASNENLYIAVHLNSLVWGTPVMVRLVRNRLEVRLHDGTLLKTHVEFSKKVAP